MPPPAPGWFSVSTCWFQILLSRSARMRNAASFAEPAAESTTIRTGLFGQSDCAAAAPTIVSVNSANSPSLLQKAFITCAPLGCDDTRSLLRSRHLLDVPVVDLLAGPVHHARVLIDVRV